MGIEDTIKVGADLLEKEDKELLETFELYRNKKNQGKLFHGDFEGHKGGIASLSTKLYTTHEKIDKMLEGQKTAKDKLSKEALEKSALEALVVDNLKLLKKNKKAQQWLNHYGKWKKNGFTSKEHQYKILTTMASEVFGWDREEIGIMLGYAQQVAKGDEIGYRASLRELSKRTEEGLYSARLSGAIETIQNNARAAEAVKHHYLNKSLKEHKHHPKDLAKIENMSFVEAADAHYKLGETLGDQGKKDIEKLGYVPVSKKK